MDSDSGKRDDQKSDNNQPEETLLNLKILESNHLISTHESDTSPDQSDNETSNKVINII